MTKDLDTADNLLATGEAVMALYSQNHAYLARHKSDKTAITWHQQILLGEYLVIPRGAPHRAEAERLIDYIVSPGPQSRLSKDLTYSPINIDAVPDATMARAWHASPTARPTMPSSTTSGGRTTWTR